MALSTRSTRSGFSPFTEQRCLRILFLATKYHPVIGGAETYARELTRGLAAHGHEVVVITNARCPGDSAVTVDHGVTIIRDCGYQDSLFADDKSTWEQLYFSLLESTNGLIDLTNCDLIHANSHDTAIFGSMLKLDALKPLVLTSHEIGREDGPFGAGRCRLIFGHLPIDAFIAVSRHYETIMHDFGAAPIHRIYLGVDTHKFSDGYQERTRDALGLSRDAFVVVCLARLKARKGILELLHAVAVAAQQIPKLHLVLAGTTSSGSSDYAAEVAEEIALLNLSNFVTIIQDLSHDEVPPLLRSSDVAVQPSHSEGLGLATIEAMACGVPVVVSRASGLTEVVEHGVSGLQVQVGDTSELTKAIIRIAHDPRLRSRLTAAAQETVDTHFSLDRMVAETEALYLSLLNSSEQSPT